MVGVPHLERSTMDRHETINYVELPATNLEATKAFFEAVFGWSFVDYGPDYTAFSGQGLDGGFFRGCVATFKKRQESDGSGRAGAVSRNHPERLVDELNLSPTIRTAHPPRLPLPDHVHGLGSLDRSPRRVECTQALLRCHASFDRSMILLHDVVHVLDRSVAATASQDPCLFHPRNCRAVETGLVSVDDAGLRMRRIRVLSS